MALLPHQTVSLVDAGPKVHYYILAYDAFSQNLAYETLLPQNFGHPWAYLQLTDELWEKGG